MVLQSPKRMQRRKPGGCIMESKRKNDPELGLFLYHAIEKAGYTQEEIAEELGVSREAVNMYCSGRRKPQQRTLLTILRLTNVQAKDIPF